MRRLQGNATPWLLLSLLLVAAALRIYGIAWDQGFLFHPDERAILMKVSELSFPSLSNLGVLLDADKSPLNPRWFPYGSLPLYLLRLGSDILGRFTGPLSIAGMAILGRSFSAILDTVSVLAVYLLGAHLYSRKVGLLAAAFTAFTVLHIQLSHFYTVETIVTPFILLSLFFLWKVVEKGSLWGAALGGLFFGLALATKVSSAPLALSFVVAGLLFLFRREDGSLSLNGVPRSRWSRAVGAVVLAGAVALIAFVVAEPYALLDWRRFVKDVVEQGEMVRRIRDYPYTRQYVDTPAFLYQIQQLTVWGMGIPLGVVGFAGLVFTTVVVLKKRLPADVLILSWVLPYFLITGIFQVKFLRYLLMITPLLSLMGARMLFAWRDYVTRRDVTEDELSPLEPMPGRDLNEYERAWIRRRYGSGPEEAGRRGPAGFRRSLGTAARLASSGKYLVTGVIALVLVLSVLYALAYRNIYSQPHPAVRLSQWINANVPVGTAMAAEHWEEGIPELGRYRVLTLPMYDEDTYIKKQQVLDILQEVDYVIFYSNRLYGTIPRLQERYPLTTRYYQLLFSGQLGFEPAYSATSYPSLAGVTLVDDTFSRPGLPVPQFPGSLEAAPWSLNLGYADESFTAYDHPKVMAFKKVRRLSADEMSDLLGELETPRLKLGLVYSPAEFQRQAQGGTWSEIFASNWLTDNVPEIAWLLAIQGMALAALPIAFYLFRSLPDRGYLLAKPLGLLLVAYVPWLLASLKWLPFSRGSVGLGMLLVAGLSIGIYWRTRAEFHSYLRERWRLILLCEVLFLLSFLFFYGLRLANPDLWHPYRGGEKPMDFAYLNAVVKSDYMPPYDPWFAGGYLNYYYYGQFLVAALIKFTGVQPSIAYNLAVPLFFALTFTGVFSLVYNLTEHQQRSRGASSGWFSSTVLAGIAGGVFVAILGNLDGLVQVVQGAWQVVTAGGGMPTFDYWRSSRMMPPTISITEFPYFTFLFADLHAHLIVIPFSVLTIGLAVALMLSFSAGEGKTFSRQLPLLAAMGFLVGTLRWINTWDFPTYLLLTSAVAVVIEVRLRQGLDVAALLVGLVKAGVILGLGILFYLPLQRSNETFYLGVILSPERTPLWQYLEVHGFFLFLVLSYLVYLLRREFRGAWWLWRFVVLPSPPASAGEAPPPSAVAEERHIQLNGKILLYAGFVLLVGAALLLLGFSTGAFLLVLLLILIPMLLKRLFAQEPGEESDTFALLIIGLAFAIGLGVELVTVQGDIQRMNTVFKFYLQAWVLLGVASAFVLWRLGTIFYEAGLNWGRGVWVAVFGFLLAAALIYPLLATPVRLRDRFQTLSPTRDGMEFMKTARYQDEKGEIDLSYDWEALRWVQQNIKGSPVILEGITPLYRWGSRVSIYTGLPAVIGWDWHQNQQRLRYEWAVRERQDDVNRLYSTTNTADALRLLKKYGVKYIYLGQVERLYYPQEGISKFKTMEGSFLEKIHDNPEVVIYRVRD